MMIHEITQKVGRSKSRKRIGRGEGSGTGCTAGRGHKGAGSRAGSKKRPGFEGGQMPLFRRIPKRGFSNANFRVHYHIVNLKTLEEQIDSGATVTPELLVEKKIIRDTKSPVKILGEGDLTKKLDVTAARFSGSAKDKIEKAGGSVNEVRKVTWKRLPGKKKTRTRKAPSND